MEIRKVCFHACFSVHRRVSVMGVMETLLERDFCLLPSSLVFLFAVMYVSFTATCVVFIKSLCFRFKTFV